MMPRHTPRSSDYLQPRAILENLSLCPFGGTYVALHLNSIEKILNHILALVLLLNVMLFLSSFSVVFMPLSAFNTTFISMLLLAQTIIVWLILNNHRVSMASCLAPTEFKIGVAFGLCVAAAILAFLVSHGFARPDAVCAAFQSTEISNTNQRFVLLDDPATDNSTEPDSSSSSSSTSMPFLSTYTMCSTHKGSMVAVWFWSGLVFWCNFVSALLLWVGQSELANASPYENLSMDDFEDHFRRQQVANGTAAPPAFVGDYATVPEIRTDESNLSQGMMASQTSHLGGYNTSTNGFSDVAVTTTV